MKRALFPGSFDPITLGHTDIIERSLTLFDEVVVAIGDNSQKHYMFDLEKRIGFIESIYHDRPQVKVTAYTGLTIDSCQKIGADFILRGLRNPADFEFEKAIAHTNRKLSGIETVFFLTATKTAYISSSIVREIISHGGDYTALVPPQVRID